MKAQFVTVLALAGTFVSTPLFAANMTLTGEVSDMMCGAKHPIADATACTNACVAKGSDYALVVDGKVYDLKADAKAKAELAKLAGKTAMIHGDVNGTTVTVTSVMMPNAH